jgi:hypothetical protein
MKGLSMIYECKIDDNITVVIEKQELEIVTKIEGDIAIEDIGYILDYAMNVIGEQLSTIGFTVRESA